VTFEVERELGGARLRLMDLSNHGRKGKGHGGWAQSPHACLVWLRRGRIHTFYGDEGKSPLLRVKNSVVFHPPSLRRRSDYLGASGADFLIVPFLAETESGLDLLSFIDVPRLFQERDAAGFRGIFSRLMKGLSGEDPVALAEHRLARRRDELALLSQLLRASKLDREALSLALSSRLRPVFAELSARFHEDLDVGALAAKAGLSRPQFHRNFKSLTGMAPVEYRKRLRLREAERLLRTCDLGVGEIGERVGWPNPFHFSRIFKATFRCSPLKYRNGAPDQSASQA
jgi:AraC-like DNA-binding protein